MDEAFLTLLEQKDFEYITVKEICAAAGVNRSTFYLHYETVGDLLAESVQHMYGQFLAHMEKDSQAMIKRLRTCPKEELYLLASEYLVPYLNYVAENRRLFSTALEKAGTLQLEDAYGSLMRHVFTLILDRFGVPEADRGYMMAFFVQGVMAVVGEWLRDGCKDSVEHVAAVIQRCVPVPE